MGAMLVKLRPSIELHYDNLMTKKSPHAAGFLSRGEPRALL
jgi:hypothetical protein